MSNFPDFSKLGYQVIRELGHNYVGGRITYLATNLRIQQSVVVKQFHFAKFSSDWSGFKAYEREIQVLQGLNHPGIPRYLDSGSSVLNVLNY
jgi:serine/threonine protein kinase